MVKLRNGKNLQDALNEFRAYKKPVNKKKNDSYSYFKISEYIDLLDKCFGIDGYSPRYSEGKLETLPTGQCVLLVKANVDIFGEDGSVCWSFEGYGTYEITYSSDSQKFINLQTVGMNANVNALKGACCNAGAFGKRSEDGKSSADTQSAKPVRQVTSSSGSTPILKRFYYHTPFVELHKDKDGVPSYRFAVHEEENGRLREKQSEVIFYPNQYKKCPEEFNALYLRASQNAKEFVSLYVSPVAEEHRNKDFHASYIFKSFC